MARRARRHTRRRVDPCSSIRVIRVPAVVPAECHRSARGDKGRSLIIRPALRLPRIRGMIGPHLSTRGPMASRIHLSLALLALVAQPARAQRAQPARLTSFDPSTATELRWRYVGPVGNRVASVVGVPGDPNVYYAGAASGGGGAGGAGRLSSGGVVGCPYLQDRTGGRCPHSSR